MRQSRTALIALAIMALVWGYNWVVMKEVTALVSPFDFLGARLAIAAICLFAALAALGRSMRLVHAWHVTAIGLIHTGATFSLMMFALMFGTAGKTAVLSYCMPFFVMLLAWPVLGETPSKTQWLAIAIAMIGLGLLFNPQTNPGLSEVLAFASGITWAIGVVITKRLQARHQVETLALTAWQMLIGGIAMIALAIAFPIRPWTWTPYVAFAVAFNGIVVSALSWFLWFWVLGKVESGVASLGTLAAPVIGVLAGAVELGERPRPVEWLGIALVVCALTVVALAAIQRGSRPTDVDAPT